MEKLLLLGIDFKSVLLYLLSYGILLGVLGYFFFPKLLKVIDERRESIRHNLENAEKLQFELEKQVADHMKEKQSMAEEFRLERERSLKDIDDKRKMMMKEMEEHAEKVKADTNMKIEQQQMGLILGAEDKIVQIMKNILIEVLSDVSEETIEKSVVSAWKKQKNQL